MRLDDGMTIRVRGIHEDVLRSCQRMAATTPATIRATRNVLCNRLLAAPAQGCLSGPAGCCRAVLERSHRRGTCLGSVLCTWCERCVCVCVRYECLGLWWADPTIQSSHPRSPSTPATCQRQTTNQYGAPPSCFVLKTLASTLKIPAVGLHVGH